MQTASPFSVLDRSPSGPLSPPLPKAVRNRLRKGSRRNWLELAWDFPDERDCLASFLALETAEVLAGAKPANLIRLSNRQQLCGRNLHHLWRSFGASLLADSKLQVLSLRDNSEGELLLFFSSDLLHQLLRAPAVTTFLQQLGYPPSGDLQSTLAELQGRFRDDFALPHEIGVFLGYPLKDVAGYMGRTDLPCTGCRLWRIYGDPGPSLALSEHYIACRNRMADRLRLSHNPKTLLHGAPASRRHLGTTEIFLKGVYRHVHPDHRRRPHRLSRLPP